MRSQPLGENRSKSSLPFYPSGIFLDTLPDSLPSYLAKKKKTPLPHKAPEEKPPKIKKKLIYFPLHPGSLIFRDPYFMVYEIIPICNWVGFFNPPKKSPKKP